MNNTLAVEVSFIRSTQYGCFLCLIRCDVLQVYY